MLRFIKSFALVAMLIVMVLLFLGVFVPEVDHSFSLRVDRPIVTAQTAMMNPATLGEWLEGLKQVEPESGLPGMAGSTYLLHYAKRQGEVTYRLEILEMKPLKRLKLRISDDVMSVDCSVNFEAAGPVTDLGVLVQARGNGLLARCLLPLMQHVVMEEAERSFRNYKSWVESR